MIIKSDFRYSVKFLFAFVVIFSAILMEKANAQISADKASYRTLTEYTSTANDSIFVFCDNIGTGIGELRADSPDGTNGWTFAWTKWDATANDFVTNLVTEANQSFSILSNLTDGRYRVVMTKSGETDVTSIAWVLNNSNADPVLTFSRMNCDGVYFAGSFSKKDLQYQDVPNANQINVKVDDRVRFSLQRNGEEKQGTPFVAYDGSEKDLFDNEAYEGDETYQLVVTDQYACEFTSSSIISNTYVVKADFSVAPDSGEAPLEDVIFTNNSINATDYKWYLYQDYDRLPEELTSVEDSLLTDTILLDKDLAPYTYQYSGKYQVKLIVTSDKGPEVCMDEMMLSTPIVVDTSLVQVPNVFTPNGDGRNDIWKVKTQSLFLESFHAIVFNRWGRVVYEWRNPEDGWNGKVNGKMATPGTYFYVITAVGREEPQKKYTKKGSFMLIRK
ncbi:gliding motility-associated C-terminal domain-containing protein [Marinifilum sp. D714]|uniref:gliding motility-associated C-terminal domain-containing protein n=1 Tax=Marinifilum sp. D714 TaxID=2937523 RepID=UPI0027BB7195|nr:gliding motility-associated C-terminal domain-containing protein [Marinifilum sp. D714]MDQ2177426.1 gliding motility-associated C-terminal domain-containing protein [Marinifilum sp. D714]